MHIIHHSVKGFVKLNNWFDLNHKTSFVTLLYLMCLGAHVQLYHFVMMDLISNLTYKYIEKKMCDLVELRRSVHNTFSSTLF